MKLVVLASGRGSNFAAIADAVSRGEIPHTQVCALITNRPGAPALDLARERNITTVVVDSGRFRREGKLDRAAYEAELDRAVRSFSPDYVCLAGYMLILGEKFVSAWEGKLINIHPSLLPAFPGLHPQKQALDAGAEKTGCTVHWVIQEVDAGAAIARGELKILPGDTPETLAERLLPVEHATYVKALKTLAEHHVSKRSK
jgi:phosphoribosylglycinamide formyltransferase 1